MTCDAGRPCKRCVHRGLSDSCEDAPRKKKKYLADVSPVALLNNPTPSTAETDGKSNTGSGNTLPYRPLDQPMFPGDNKSYSASLLGTSASTPVDFRVKKEESQNMDSMSPYPQQATAPMFHSHSTNNYPGTYPSAQPDFQFDTGQQEQIQENQAPSEGNNYNDRVYNQLQQKGTNRNRTNFLSLAAGLEYLTLSGILQDNLTNFNHSTSNEGTPNSISLSPAVSPQAFTNGQQHFNQSNIRQPGSTDVGTRPNGHISPYMSRPSQTPSPGDHIRKSITGSENSIYNGSRYPKCDESINQYFLGPTEGDQVLMFPDVITMIEMMKRDDPSVYHESKKPSLSFTIGIIPEDNYNYSKLVEGENDISFKEPEEIYEKVVKPFSYTPGYHLLIAYLRKRFSKPMLVKMAESMAAYRPSFIACTNSLKEGDLIFMEQCFQRTLLTYDNFIRVSGTPTIVWRRTGEIAYVGNEFCILTGWLKTDLMGGDKKKFIVELLDDKSVVEYFQLFSRIAFGDFLGATMTECTLLTPKGVKIRTGCMWTLKRDVFGIPMMIIGNFLPIL